MRKIKPIILFLFLPFLLLAEKKIQSPSGRLSANIEVKNDHVNIDLLVKDSSVLQIRTLRFQLEKEIAEGIWELSGENRYTHDEIWQPVYGERSLIRDRYNEQQLSLVSSGNRKEVKLYIRMYDKGIAVRYEFDKLDFWNQMLTCEQTEFIFDKDYETWITERAQ